VSAAQRCVAAAVMKSRSETSAQPLIAMRGSNEEQVGMGAVLGDDNRGRRGRRGLGAAQCDLDRAGRVSVAMKKSPLVAKWRSPLVAR